MAYYTWFHASKGGATLGKMAVGIKVRSNGERLTKAARSVATGPCC
jgi:uncharacterized RDD family membrane protein YckC